MLAFSNDYYGMIFRATQSVELFCAYIFSDRSSLSGSIIIKNRIFATKFPHSARSIIFLRSYSSSNFLSIYTNFTTSCRKVKIDSESSWRICSPAPLFSFVLQDKIFNFQGSIRSNVEIEREYIHP